MGSLLSSSARQALAVLGMVGIHQPPVDPWAVVEGLQGAGVALTLLEQPQDGFEGCTLKRDGKTAIILNASIDYLPRRRFTLSHELGHAMLGDHTGIFECLGSVFENPSAGRQEKEANDFASELLLPTEWLRKDLGYASPSLALARQLGGDRYGASVTATALKLVEIADEPCALLLSEKNRVRWMKRSDRWPAGYYVPLDRPLDPRTAAARYFRGNDLPPTATEIQVKAWAPEARVDEDTWLLEESLAIPNLGQVLTMLLPQEDLAW